MSFHVSFVPVSVALNEPPALTGSPCGFGGVRHQHRFDAQLAEQLEHIAEGQALRLKRREGIDHAFWLWPLAIGQEVFTPPPNPMHLFRDVGKLKVRGKGAQQFARQFRPPSLDPRA